MVKRNKMVKNVFMIILVIGLLVVCGGGVSANCGYCSSELDCIGNYDSCEDFEGYITGTNFWCDGTAPGGGSTWHDLRAMPDTAAGNCINAYGIVQSEIKFNGDYSFESRVNSVSDGSSTGYHGGYVFINDNVGGAPNELWNRYYLYVPSTNYYTGSGAHCNHHNFLSDGAGAYPSLDVRHYFWQRDGTGNSDYLYGDDGKLYLGVHSYAQSGGEHFQAGGQTYQEGPPYFALSDHFDEWISIEWYLNDITKQMKLWVNGIQTVDTGSTMDYSKSPTGFQIGQYNCQNNDVGTTWKMYIDNIVVSSTDYIGPMQCIDEEEITVLCYCGGQPDPDDPSNIYTEGYCCNGVWQNESCLGDSSPPTRSNPQPTTNLSSGTTQTTISLSTDEAATCRYSTTQGTSYASMTNTFTTTGSTAHSRTITGLTDGNTYTYYVRCIDGSGNANTDDNFFISFSVANPTSSCTSGADSDGNSVVSIGELINYISSWKSGTVTIGDLIIGIGEWKNGC